MLRRLYVAILSVFVVPGLLLSSGGVRAEIASKAYVDRIQTEINNILSGTPSAGQVLTATDTPGTYTWTTPAAAIAPDWGQTDATAPGFIQNKPEIPAAQIQSDWAQTDETAPDFIKNKPGENGNGAGALYGVRSNSVQNANNGDSFFVDYDSLRFKLSKVATSCYWGARIVNNGAVTVELATSMSQMYGAEATYVHHVSVAPGAETNPDSSDDTGYSCDGGTNVIYVFDITNMHMYRWTNMTYGNNGAARAVSVVEKLY